MFKSPHYLKIVEYISISAASISLLVAVASKETFLASILVLVALVINLINRLRPVASRSKLSVSVRLEELERQIAELKTEIARLSHQLTDSEELLISQQPSQERSPQTKAAATQAISISQQPPKAPQWNCIRTLREHTDSVSSVAISPNGQLLASVSWDKTIALWSLDKGNIIDRLTGHSQGLLTVTFAGNYLATGSFDQTIKLWEINERAPDELRITSIDRLTEHNGSVRSLAVTPDNQTIISGSYDRTMKQWQLDNRRLLRTWRDESGAVSAIAITQDGKIVASGSSSGQITLWQLDREEPLDVLTDNLSSVASVAFSPDGKTLAIG